MTRSLSAKQLAADYPRDASWQRQYAHALAEFGDYPAAYAWLTRVLAKESKGLDWEEELLRNTYAQLLRQQGRSADLVAYLAAWVQQDPSGTSAYNQYLTALIKSDQIEKADALALRWLKDAEVPGELPTPAEARLNAAVRLMLGQGFELYTNRVEQRWRTPLAQAVRFFARHESRAATAEHILSQHPFQHTDEARTLRKALAGILSADIDKLPADAVQRLAGWARFGDAEPAAWNKIAAKLRQRWTAATEDAAKHKLGQALVGILSRQETATELLAFLRLQHQTGPEEHRAEYANWLFDRLLAQPWSADFETEALALLDKLSTAEEPGTRLLASVAALHRLTDAMLASRIAAGAKTLEHPEKLTRTELLKKQEERRQRARESLADRLRKDADKQPKALGRWLKVESHYLDVPLERHLKQAATDAWAIIRGGSAPQGHE